MEAHCTKPRPTERSLPFAAPKRAAAPLRGALPLAVAALALGLSGCSIVFPPGPSDGCTSLTEMCPNLECEAGFLVDDEGCALCECADVGPEPQPTGCFSDGDCRPDEMCVFGGGQGGDGREPAPRDAGPAPTEPAPGQDGGPAPEPPEDAGAPSFCDPAVHESCGDEDRVCEPNAGGNCGGDADRPAEDPPTGELVMPEGMCVPVSCPAIGIACPPGQHAEYDYSTNPCGDARCVPDETQPSECTYDGDCPGDMYCEILDECGSLCAPGSNEPCPDVCVVIGRCVDPGPPTGCTYDNDCGTGFVCEYVEVCGCSDGAAPPPDDDDLMPPEDGGADRPAPPCWDSDCAVYGQCVWNPENVTCYFDGECGEGQRCEYLDNCIAPPDCPNCLIACQGICVDDEPEPVACMSDDECGADEVCDQINYCEAHPGCGDGQNCLPVCYGRCVAPEPPTSDRCLEQGDCAEGFRCASEVDFCYCPDGESCDVCYWQCVPDDA